VQLGEKNGMLMCRREDYLIFRTEQSEISIERVPASSPFQVIISNWLKHKTLDYLKIMDRLMYQILYIDLSLNPLNVVIHSIKTWW